jgi:hypothetical protein
MKHSLHAIWRWVKWPLLLLALAYAVLVVYRVPAAMEKQKTQSAVAEIHAAKITMADVTGDTKVQLNVDQATYDATVAGIDTNHNGIRDDVEIAIFKKYPDSPKIRAAELQYALAEQMYLTRVFNTETWKAVAEEVGRADLCVLDSKGDWNFIENLIFNTQIRKAAKTLAFTFTTSYGPKSGPTCDVTVN